MTVLEKWNRKLAFFEFIDYTFFVAEQDWYAKKTTKKDYKLHNITVETLNKQNYANKYELYYANNIILKFYESSNKISILKNRFIHELKCYNIHTNYSNLNMILFYKYTVYNTHIRCIL